jgi:hypothetical protein
MRAVCSGKIEKLLPLLQFRVQFYIDLVTQQPIELRLEPMTTIGSDLLDTKNSSQVGKVGTLRKLENRFGPWSVIHGCLLDENPNR